jgi:protein arginine kinase activator
MLCDLCKQNEAKVHLTQIVEGVTKKIDLCEACSKEKGVEDPAGFSLADLLLGLGASQEKSEEAATAEEGGNLACPHCGFTQADFKKSGRLGCSACYEIFAEPLESLLKSMHKGTQHVGKVPRAFKQTEDASARLKALSQKLDKAIADEDFEQAAMLRDEIKLARQKLAELPPG